MIMIFWIFYKFMGLGLCHLFLAKTIWV